MNRLLDLARRAVVAVAAALLFAPSVAVAAETSARPATPPAAATTKPSRPGDDLPIAFRQARDAADADPARADLDALWTAYVAGVPVRTANDALVRIGGLGEHADPEICARQSDDIAVALAVVPLSLLARQTALACAEARGDAGETAKQRAWIGRLLAVGLADGRGGRPDRPMRLTTPLDIPAFLQAKGVELLSALYDPRAPDSTQSIALWVYDAAAKRERAYYVDVVETLWAQSRRPEPATWPGSRRATRVAIAVESANAGEPAAMLAKAISGLRASPHRPDAAALLRQAATVRRNADAALAQLEFCANGVLEGCGEDAVADLSRLLERGDNGLALIGLAVAKARGIGVPQDRAAATALLARAVTRLGETEAFDRYAVLLRSIEEPSRAPGRDTVEALHRAVDAGGSGASALAALLIHEKKLDPRRRETALGILRRADPEQHPWLYLTMGSIADADKDDSGAFDAFRRASAAGYWQASWWLSERLRGHYRTSVVPSESLSFRLLAAQQGGASACIAMASRFPETAPEFVQWLESAVQLGSSDASIVLGDHYAHASPPDLERAREAYGRAAQRNDATAVLRLADLLIDHPGKPEDVAAGLQLLTAQAEAGRVPAMRDLWLRRRSAPAAGVDPARLAAWLKAAVERKELGAFDPYATLLLTGTGVARDVRAALRTWDLGASLGDLDSAHHAARVRCSLEEGDPDFDPKNGLAKALALETPEDRPGEAAGRHDTIAACKAANGAFDEAVDEEQEAIDALQQWYTGADLERSLPVYRARLDRYRQGRRSGLGDDD